MHTLNLEEGAHLANRQIRGSGRRDADYVCVIWGGEGFVDIREGGREGRIEHQNKLRCICRGKRCLDVADWDEFTIFGISKCW